MGPFLIYSEICFGLSHIRTHRLDFLLPPSLHPSLPPSLSRRGKPAAEHNNKKMNSKTKKIALNKKSKKMEEEKKEKQSSEG